jgi:hypothetical protein
MAASAWIEKTRTPKGKVRWRVRYRLGGAETPPLYAGKFARKSDAAERRDWIVTELAAMRVPNLRRAAESPKQETPTTPTLRAATTASTPSACLGMTRRSNG